ncbi:hypothetical protein TWF281_008052 [Arthrobotrys megalospora]
MASAATTAPTTKDVVEFMFGALRGAAPFCTLFQAFKAKYPGLAAMNTLWETVVELRGIGDLLGLHEDQYHQEMKSWEEEEAKKVAKTVTNEELDALVEGMGLLAIHNYHVPTSAVKKLAEGTETFGRGTNKHLPGSKADHRAAERLRAKDVGGRRAKKAGMRRKLGGGH